MKRKVHLSIEEEAMTKLKDIAGGQRKVGAFITAVTHWLYEQKEVLGRIPLEECEIRDACALTEIEEFTQRLTAIETMLASCCEQGKDKV